MPKIPIEYFELPNGLKVVVSEDHSVPTVSLSLVYDVGSRSEKEGRSGFAHLFEHMMFQGSSNVGKAEHLRFVESRGGDANGFTTKDFTCYYETLPSKELELGLWLEADRLQSLNISRENYANQKDVVSEEKRMRYDNQPYMSAIGEEFPKFVFSNWSNAHSVIGSFEDLEKASLGDITEFFNAFYVASNAVLTIVGDASPEALRPLVEKYFGNIGRGIKPVRPNLDEPPHLASSVGLVTDPYAPQPMLILSWLAPKRHEREFAGMAVLGSILSEGQDSRLYQKLVKEKEWSLDISGGLGFPFGSFMTMKDPMPFSLMTRFKPQLKYEGIAQLIFEQIAEIADGKIDQEELLRTRRKFKAELLDDLSHQQTLCFWMGIYTALSGKAHDFLKEITRYIEDLDKSDIQSAARFLDASKAKVFLIEPKARVRTYESMSV